MKTYTLDEVTDTLIGKIGTINRDKFELDLQMELNRNIIKRKKYSTKK